MVADELDDSPESLTRSRELLQRLTKDLLPHEHAEEHELFPRMGALMSGAEIDVQVAQLERLLGEITERTTPADLTALRGLLYGLYAILRLHNAQEEEGLFSLLRRDRVEKKRSSDLPPIDRNKLEVRK